MQQLSVEEFRRIVSFANTKAQNYQGVVGYLQTQGFNNDEVQKYQDMYKASGNADTVPSVKRSHSDLDQLQLQLQLLRLFLPFLPQRFGPGAVFP